MNAKHRQEDFSSDDCLPEPLSGAGRQRRDSMLAMLQPIVVREHRRRRVRRVALRSAAVATFVVVAAVLVVPPRGPNPASVAEVSPQVQPVETPAYRVSYLSSQPGALERYRADIRVDASAYIVDDRQLVATLIKIGRPAGLIRTGGQVTLTRPVTDAALAGKSAADPPTAPTHRS